MAYPDQVWGTDITYIRLFPGMDVPGGVHGLVLPVRGELGTGPDDAGVFRGKAADRALTMAKPQIINSDQGSQYTSPQYVELVSAAGVRISMDGRGRAHATTSSRSALVEERA